MYFTCPGIVEGFLVSGAIFGLELLNAPPVMALRVASSTRAIDLLTDMSDTES